MAFTPTDPTKAEVRITGTAPNQQLDFYIPRGAKGEPGGITYGTVIDTQNLNDLKVPGVYRRTSTGTGLLLLNYPSDTDSGVLIVHTRLENNTTYQEFHTFNRASAGSRGFYIRTLSASGTVWSPWQFLAANRVDQTAGRAIYTWDHVNDREQLIYGDTGWRDLTPANGWTASSLKVRREGRTVHVVALGISGAAATGDAVTEALPVGFRATGHPLSTRVPLMTSTAADSSRAAMVDISTHTLRIMGAAYTGVTAGHVATSYLTLDNWPTTLPGTAVGTIPNL